MQKRKKQLLGMGGLAVVVASTTYAATIPTPDAGAAGNNASTSGNVSLQVQVYSDNPEAKITTISDGEVVTGSNLSIGGLYSDADKVEFEMYKKNPDGSKTYAELGGPGVDKYTYVPADPPENGQLDFPFDLNSSEDLGYGDYVLTMTVTSQGSTVESIVSFRYAPLSISYIGSTENGDPIVEVTYAENVASVDIQAYNESGAPLFDSPINYPVSNPGVAGTLRVALPFLDYGAASGDYTISAVGKDANGGVIDPTAGPVYTTAPYKSPESPEVPKTGDITKQLNMSRADFLITGLIGFGLFTALALYLLRKQRR